MSWTSFTQDGNLGGIFARQYDSNGSAVGTKFQVDTRLLEFERRVEIHFGEQTAVLDGRLADLGRRVTARMLAGIAVISVLIELL